MGRRGGLRVVFILFFSGSLRSPILYILKIFENPNYFQVQRVIPSPVMLTIPGFHEIE